MLVQTPAVFVHPNNGSEIIITGEVFAVMYLEQNKTYALIGAGNAVIPVAGSKEDILAKLKEREGKYVEPTITERPDGKISKHKGNKKGK